MISRVAVAGFVTSTLLGCAAIPPPLVTPAHVKWADATWPDATLASLDEGRTLLLRKCNDCHNTPTMSQETPAKWPDKIEEMGQRAHLKPTDIELIKRYVVTAASVPAQPSVK